MWHNCRYMRRDYGPKGQDLCCRFSWTDLLLSMMKDFRASKRKSPKINEWQTHTPNITITVFVVDTMPWRCQSQYKTTNEQSKNHPYGTHIDERLTALQLQGNLWANRSDAIHIVPNFFLSRSGHSWVWCNQFCPRLYTTWIHQDAS